MAGARSHNERGTRREREKDRIKIHTRIGVIFFAQMRTQVDSKMAVARRRAKKYKFAALSARFIFIITIYQPLSELLLLLLTQHAAVVVSMVGNCERALING